MWSRLIKFKKIEILRKYFFEINDFMFAVQAQIFFDDGLRQRKINELMNFGWFLFFSMNQIFFQRFIKHFQMWFRMHFCIQPNKLQTSNSFNLTSEQINHLHFRYHFLICLCFQLLLKEINCNTFHWMKR